MEQKSVYNAAEKDCLSTDTNSNYILEKLDIKVEEDCDRFYENPETLQNVIGMKQEPPDVVTDGIINNQKTEYCSDFEDQSNFDKPIDIKQEELIIKSEIIDLPKRRLEYLLIDHSKIIIIMTDPQSYAERPTNNFFFFHRPVVSNYRLS